MKVWLRGKRAPLIAIRTLVSVKRARIHRQKRPNTHAKEGKKKTCYLDRISALVDVLWRSARHVSNTLATH